MPNCTHCHQPQTAALVICPECYRALTERTVSMETDKLIEALREESRYKDKATLEIMDLCMMAADKLEELNDFEQSQCAKLLAQLAEKDKQFAAAVALIPHTCHSCGKREGWKTCHDAAFISDGEECLNWTLCGPQEAGEVGNADSKAD